MKILSLLLIATFSLSSKPVVQEGDICVRLLQMTADIQECWRNSDTPPRPSQNCNVFAGRVLKEIYGHDDFWNKAEGQYYSANDIYLNLITNNSWTTIGTCDNQDNLRKAQEFANNGKCVIAAYFNNSGGHGHVAIIVKGNLSPSGEWRLNVPNSASYSNSRNNQYVCDKLSKAFGADKKASTTLYYK